MSLLLHTPFPSTFHDSLNFSSFRSPIRCLSQDDCKQENTIEEDDFPLCSSNQRKPPPLVTALEASAEQNAASFHFPGHNRGRSAPSTLTHLIGARPFTHDLPELDELDNLFSPEGPILEAQREASELFGASETWFLVGGTTCGIQAAIMATCGPGDVIILPRNSHLSAVSGMVLSGAVPKYIVPEYSSEWDIAGGVVPSQVAIAIREVKTEGRKSAVVLITSPTYHGICSDITEISRLCHSHGIPLIVDEAHGAHLGFHPQMPESALHQGADLAVQSTHKVLCSLTQSSMLHLSGNLVDRDRICSCLQMLQSSSPSYLLLASLDAARHQISENPKAIFDEALKMVVEAKNAIREFAGVSVLNSLSFTNFPTIDPLRLTVSFSELGLSGYKADEILYKDHEIVCELVGTRSMTFAFNLGTSEEHVERLVSGIKHLVSSSSGSIESALVSAPFSDSWTSLTPRDAFFRSKRRVSIEKCVGEVCGELICPYPPGIPAMIPGETITGKALAYLLDVRNKGALITGASDPELSSILVCNS